ncbi:unnamed protein product [Spirodela intermedia]|uniref:Uncharacterized protein n=1 Tax=Spirodela intermedia TaxID=51605 RepID=A0A7I8IQE6_SPIIN|nr:unnamed protein product [Spirodela intermedia]CAA6660129.1 unnamed protein product [Spirodela intermedia]
MAGSRARRREWAGEDEELDRSGPGGAEGCLDLGFGFSYEDIPELCNTLPALKLCNTMNQKLPKERRRQQQQSILPESPGVGGAGTIPTWRICRPGDEPEEVKARLKLWAQVVACIVRLCR